MLAKTITFNDYNGVERTETHYFNLTETELIEMDLVRSGGMAEMLERIVAAKDSPAIINIFKELIMKSYGEKSVDGRRFKKSQEISEAFIQTEAYNKLFLELMTDSEKASSFVIGIIPATLGKQASMKLMPLA